MFECWNIALQHENYTGICLTKFNYTGICLAKFNNFKRQIKNNIFEMLAISNYR